MKISRKVEIFGKKGKTQSKGFNSLIDFGFNTSIHSFILHIMGKTACCHLSNALKSNREIESKMEVSIVYKPNLKPNWTSYWLILIADVVLGKKSQKITQFRTRFDKHRLQPRDTFLRLRG